MTLEQLVALFRQEADDTEQPYRFSPPCVTALLNEAVEEAAIRARLIHESDDNSICRIAVIPTQAGYTLHQTLYEVTHLAFRESGSSRRTPVKIVSTEWLDDNESDWRDWSETPKYAIQTDKRLRLVPTPDVAGELLLEGYRLPLTLLSNNAHSPEINAAHHRHLVKWALYRAMSNPDVDDYDPESAERALSEFERYFGKRPDADLRRSTRHDEPHHVVAIL